MAFFGTKQHNIILITLKTKNEKARQILIVSSDNTIPNIIQLF